MSPLPKIDIFSRPTSSATINAVRTLTITKVNSQHGVSSSDLASANLARRAEELVPLPADRAALPPAEHDEILKERKRLINRMSAVMSRERREVYPAELERAVEAVEGERDRLREEVAAMRRRYAETVRGMAQGRREGGERVGMRVEEGWRGEEVVAREGRVGMETVVRGGEARGEGALEEEEEEPLMEERFARAIEDAINRSGPRDSH